MTDEKLTKYDKAYLRIASEWGLLSYCKRKQVGAIIVKDRMIISDGYNGTPSGFDNCCEDDEGLTHWHVLHAEANAILKVARSTQSCEGAVHALCAAAGSGLTAAAVARSGRTERRVRFMVLVAVRRAAEPRNASIFPEPALPPCAPLLANCYANVRRWTKSRRIRRRPLPTIPTEAGYQPAERRSCGRSG